MAFVCLAPSWALSTCSVSRRPTCSASHVLGPERAPIHHALVAAAWAVLDWPALPRATTTVSLTRSATMDPDITYPNLRAQLSLKAPNGAPFVQLARALTKLFCGDGKLFKLGASERAVCHRLAIHLEAQYRLLDGPQGTLDVDCEYNREGDKPKTSPAGALVYPDIIVHRRGNNSLNHLAVEVKLTSNTERDDDDLAKLEGYRSPKFGYLYAVFLRIGSLGAASGLGIETARWS